MQGGMISLLKQLLFINLMKHSSSIPKKLQQIPISQSKASISPPSFQWIESLCTSFRRGVQQPIAVRQSLMKGSNLPRCMTHNIVLSVYCTICRRPLCASCVYNSYDHRKHRIVPIGHASDSMMEDVRSLQERIPRMVKQFEQLTQTTEGYFSKIQNQFAPMVEEVKVFYEKLKKFIKWKQSQQLSILSQREEMMKAEVVAFGKELDRMQHYIIGKYRFYQIPITNDEKLLQTRLILENLVQASPFAKLPKFQADKLSVELRQPNLQKIYDQVTGKISALIPYFKNRSKSGAEVGASRSVDQRGSLPGYSKRREEGEESGWKRMNSSAMLVGNHTFKRSFM